MLLASFVAMGVAQSTAIQINTDRNNGLSLTMQLANVASLMPYSNEFKLHTRVLTVGTFCEQSLDWLSREVGLGSPLDKVALAFFCLTTLYFPILILTLI